MKMHGKCVDNLRSNVFAIALKVHITVLKVKFYQRRIVQIVKRMSLVYAEVVFPLSRTNGSGL